MTNIEWLNKVFLKHLRKAKFDNRSYVEFFYSIFRLKERSIDTYTCLADHELRGALWVDSKPIDGLIERRVLMMRKGQHVWIRDDDGENFITLENSRGCVNIKKDDWNAKYRKYYSSGH